MKKLKKLKQKMKSPPTRVLSLDPGFAWLGWCISDIFSDGTIVVLEMGLLRTEASSKKRNVRQADDNFRRMRELCEELLDIVHHFKPKAICFEAYSPVRSSSVAGKLGMVYGALAMLVSFSGLPTTAPTPQEVKKTIGAKSKEDITKIMSTKHRKNATSKASIDLFLVKFSSVVANHNHAWDAIAVLETSMDTEVFRAIRISRIDR